MKATRVLIRGLVQGVGYRYFAERTARHLGLKGFVRNLPDGRVEAVAAGREDDVAAFITTLRQGPAAGRVDGLEIGEASLEDTVSRFEIRN
jgi:acylphosphatase